MRTEAPAGPSAAAADIETLTAAYELYYLALADRRASVQLTPPAAALPDTEHTLRIPARAGGDAAAHESDRRSWHMVALAHRALHHELGTLRFSLATADERLRAAAAAGAEGRSDLERLLACFAERRLAWQIFQTLEDLRLDSELPRRFPGLRAALHAATREAAAVRPSLQDLAPRSAAIELLVRRSLGCTPGTTPAAIAAAAAALLPLADALAHPGASVEDTALATVRAYAVIARLPNVGVVSGRTVEVATPPELVAGWPVTFPEPARAATEGDSALDVALEPVAYRDDLGGRVVAAPSAPAPMQQAVYTWRGGVTPARPERGAGVEGPPEPLPHEHHEIGGVDHAPAPDGALSPAGPHTWLYPEWDRYRSAHLPRWCRVIEQTAHPADPSAVHELATAHQLVMARVRRVMQATTPRALQVRRGLGDGDDIDFDAAVEALTDRRSGIPAREQVYQRLDRRRRDAVVGVLIDGSSSSGARVSGVPPLRPAAVHTGPPRYRDQPRVLDLELLAAILCLQAAHAVGDASAAWAFSGTGREAVRIRVLKTLREPFGGRVLQRAAGVRPDHTTRLGAAVRHATAVLAATPQALKVLLIVSDGRPYDADYGQRYGEDGAGAYALADTAHALSEARHAQVRPRVLAVGGGADADLAQASRADVEALDDIGALPERLTALYRALAFVRPAAPFCATEPEEKRWELAHDVG